MSNSSKDSASGKHSSDLTTGLELEFIACVPDTETRHIHEIVYEALTAPVSIPCPNCKQQHTLLLPFRHRRQPHAEITNSEDVEAQESYSAWNVTGDPSVHLEQDETPFAASSHTGAIEIQSRILDSSEVGKPCPHNQTLPCTGKPLTWHWRAEISSILSVLKLAFAKPGYRVLTNRTTGLHVHVGRGTLGFPILTTKNILATFVAFERILDTLVPCSRISGYDSANLPLPGISHPGFIYGYPSATEYTGVSEPHIGYVSEHSTRFFDIVAATLQPLLESAIRDPDADRLLRCLNVPAWLEMIRDAQILPQLREFGESHRTVVNLQHLPDPEGGPAHGKNTVEFRGHAGSLDGGEILAWMDFLGRVVHWCHTADEKEVFTFLMKQWANPEFVFTDLVRHVGVCDATMAHYADLSNNAMRKFTDTISALANPIDDLNVLTRVVALNRLKDAIPTAVTAKIHHKFMSGRYGQFPMSFFSNCAREEVPGFLDAAEFLCLDTCDWEGWGQMVEEWMLDDERRFGALNEVQTMNGMCGYSDLA